MRSTSRIEARFVTASVATAALLICACATQIPPLPDDRAALEPVGEYGIGAGDQLSIKFFYTSDLNEDIVVRPDGRISLQLVGDVEAAGSTPTELANRLIEKYAAFLKQPSVAVMVRGFASQRAFVGGEVKNPSMVPVDGRTTLADAVIQAGGTLDTAAVSSVILLRKGDAGREAYRVDLGAGLDGQAPLPVLRPYDVVYVPKSFIAKVGMYVDLYINRLIPKNTGFMSFYELNPVTIPAVGAGTGQ